MTIAARFVIMSLTFILVRSIDAQEFEGFDELETVDNPTINKIQELNDNEKTAPIATTKPRAHIDTNKLYYEPYPAILKKNSIIYSDNEEHFFQTEKRIYVIVQERSLEDHYIYLHSKKGVNYKTAKENIISLKDQLNLGVEPSTFKPVDKMATSIQAEDEKLSLYPTACLTLGRGNKSYYQTALQLSSATMTTSQLGFSLLLKPQIPVSLGATLLFESANGSADQGTLAIRGIHLGPKVTFNFNLFSLPMILSGEVTRSIYYQATFKNQQQVSREYSLTKDQMALAIAKIFNSEWGDFLVGLYLSKERLTPDNSGNRLPVTPSSKTEDSIALNLSFGRGLSL